MADERAPVIAGREASAATASDPERDLDEGRWHIYESNPVPWWIALLWLAFFVFGVTYLIRSLMLE